jgi:hypothetical protein
MWALNHFAVERELFACNADLPQRHIEAQKLFAVVDQSINLPFCLAGGLHDWDLRSERVKCRVVGSVIFISTTKTNFVDGVVISAEELSPGTPQWRQC